VSIPPLSLPFLGEEAVTAVSRGLSEPDWLLAERVDALRLVAGQPAEANQLFTPYHDLRAARFNDLVPYVDSGVAPDVESDLPEGASVYLRVNENAVIERAISPTARDAGVVVATFEEAVRDHPDLLRDVIEGGASLATDDAFGQVARALSSLGVLVHVPAGLTLRAPIVLRWDSGTAGRGLIARTVISLGRDAHASFLELQGDAYAEDSADAQSLWWGTMEVRLDDDASLDVASEQDLDAGTISFISRHARIGTRASLAWAMASLGGRLHKSRIDNLLVGRGASVRQVEIGFGSGDQLFDLTSYTRHVAEDTTGELLSKGIFTDRSRGYIKGLIQIQRSARGTDSYLGEFSMLLTKKARSVTIPSLEIDQPDVRRAAHSSSVGPIDEAQIFYLMSRGLDRETARKFIVLGFLEPVVARIPLPDAQEHLRELLERKWPASAAERAAA
jgi:Fe-S cluster assembly scaffold protein SufB